MCETDQITSELYRWVKFGTLRSERLLSEHETFCQYFSKRGWRGGDGGVEMVEMEGWRWCTMCLDKVITAKQAIKTYTFFFIFFFAKMCHFFAA